MTIRVPFRARVLAVAVALLVPAGLLSATPADAAKKVPVPVSPCGTTVVLKADGTPWTCTFGDDFTKGPLDSTKWLPQVTATSGYTSGGTCFLNTANNISVAGGMLKLTARRVGRPFVCKTPTSQFSTNYSSGMVSTYTKFTQTYGRFEIRAKFPASRLPGLQSSIWMYPQDPGNQPWPYGGEIDIAEWYSQYATRVIPYLHYGTSYLDPNATNTSCMVADVGAWHTYVVEWSPKVISFIYDGNVCMQNTAVAGQYPFNKAYMLALTQLMGVGDNAPTARTVMPATTDIDYVHVWS
ncbi:MAG: hypothetical protein JWP74_2953 [Marmoricola sp.]|nr:hypothetical protein [Marmoricola sp.]